MNASRALHCIIALLFAISGASAYDVLGPYNNSNTAIEYTTFSTGAGQPDHTWLYALNSYDRPRESGETGDFVDGYRYRLDTNTDTWTNFPFLHSDGTPAFSPTFYPAFLGRNRYTWASGQRWCITAATDLASDVRNSSSLGPNGGTFWWNATASQPAEWFSRLVVSRTNSRIQWLAGDYYIHSHESKLWVTTDGWENGPNYQASGLPAEGGSDPHYAVYSLAIDDRTNLAAMHALCSTTHGSVHEYADLNPTVVPPHTDVSRQNKWDTFCVSLWDGFGL